MKERKKEKEKKWKKWQKKKKERNKESDKEITQLNEKYTNLTERGKLEFHSDHTYQWLYFCFIFSHAIKENVC